jgi:hypothetical protein
MKHTWAKKYLVEEEDTRKYDRNRYVRHSNE